MFDHIKGNILALEAELYKATEALNLTEDQISSANNYLDGSDIFETAFRVAVGLSESRARQTLVDNAREAIEQTKEFDIPELREGLIEACYHDRTIEVIHTGGRGIVVNINFFNAAGDIEQYAAAVSKARSDLNIGKMPPEWRSKKWREIYQADREGFGESKLAGLYFKTVNVRRGYFDSLAPWWSILEFGSQNTFLSSSVGGKPYPSYGPTRFIERSRIAIQDLIERELESELNNEIENTNRQIRRLRDKAEALALIIAELERLIAEAEPAFKAALSKLQKQLEEFGRTQFADFPKINQIAAQLAAGERPGRQYLTRGARIRTERIYQELRQEFGK